MSQTNRILLFFVLPILALFCYPPALLSQGVIGVLIVAAMIVGLGYLLLRGRSLALTFSIFLQGMNIIIRIMMFFNNGFEAEGGVNLVYILTTLAAVVVSFYLITRLDKQDVRLTMVH